MRNHRFGNLDSAGAVRAGRHRFARWRQERLTKLRSKDYSDCIPNVRPDLPFLLQNRIEPSITWIGHSTFLIQMAGLNMVTDPVWARRMAMQKRLAPPGIAMSDMPPIDLVLVSHSHYDHLHVTSLRRLRGTKRLLVPAGLRKKMLLKGFRQVAEMNWWESVTHHGVKFTFVPAQHWARRNPWDTNNSHWGGWIIESPNGPTVYFAGDSGYCRAFEEIGRRFAIDIALLPIGAYDPEWFMSEEHMNPEEALQAFRDVGAKYFVPMHYGSFKLADDTPKEALDRLEAERRRLGLSEDRLFLLQHGETLRFMPHQEAGPSS
ncbi:MBL fold metallo-hydrolase [Cohnella lubricantis]|uniref:MBL fold metallo-hydrolase n=1 Tax=Cohnella lubricantis TaxID=2163172 RepID=A0A841TFR8_9BACL|nr:MBL fold metallo-hydrolase [Cohnella lubricantis]MBB6679186.1 MBL fold metallo-hydrolase [Cohnella lubricantis]MBP2120158.1 L-ascorbate metabolism protein UlaG (beta-lactamase superfamily) [Cohnella lubricantis]